MNDLRFLQVNNNELNYKEGKEKELKILEIIRDKFNKNIRQSTNIYSKYDYFSTDAFYELKSRTFSYNSYNYTLLATNKVFNTDKRLVFLFYFTNGLYYIIYNKEKFNTFEIKKIADGKYSDKKDYYYIPITELQKII